MVNFWSSALVSHQFDAFFRFGKLSKSRVAIARLLTFKFLMCISSKQIILFTCTKVMSSS